MEDVLDVYMRPYDSDYPVICFDEMTKQHIKETRTPINMKSGQVQLYDYEYERNGVSNIFMFVEPLTGWRHAKVTDNRTKKDWAVCMQELTEIHFPNAKKIILVEDNLNTHDPSSLYERFKPDKAREIWNKLEFHYTPKHGSWLNIAEIELSVLSRQCLNRRIPDKQKMVNEISAWEENRNSKVVKVDWQFTTKDARIKLKKLYPSIE